MLIRSDVPLGIFCVLVRVKGLRVCLYVEALRLLQLQLHSNEVSHLSCWCHKLTEPACPCKRRRHTHTACCMPRASLCYVDSCTGPTTNTHTEPFVQGSLLHLQNTTGTCALSFFSATNNEAGSTVPQIHTGLAPDTHQECTPCILHDTRHPAEQPARASRPRLLAYSIYLSTWPYSQVKLQSNTLQGHPS